jgi:hypothetical protein
VLTAVTSGGGRTIIQGTLTAASNTPYTIELFVNVECDPSGAGEGESFLASLTVTTGDDGTVSFTLILPVEVPVGQFLTATATSPDNDTSMFSLCAEVLAA